MMIKLKFLLSWMAVGLAAACGNAVDLARGGVATAVVVIEADAPVAEQTAARELVKYLNAITGGNFTIVRETPESGSRIVVGRGELARQLLHDLDFDRFRPDETVIATPDERTLVLTGAAPRGTLYAVYSFLEELGVRFWSPEHESTPTIADLTLPRLAVRYAPPFDFRQAFAETTGDRLWAVKLKMNGSLWQSAIPQEYGGDRVMDMRQSLTNDYVKPAEFFSAHPDWYAWRNSEKARVPRLLCLTNPEALDQLVREVRAELAANPELEFISVAFPDNDQFCECENCAGLTAREGAPSAQSVYAANYVARAVAADYPKVLITILAYWPTERPPKALRLESNVAVVFAMLDRNHGLPPSATARHDSYLADWERLSHGNIYIWDYYATFGNFLLPMPNLYVMEPAFRTYVDHHVRGVFAQLPFGTLAEFVELRCWLMGRLSWNPRLNSRVLVAEYLAGHYGDAAPYLQQYIDLLEAARDRQQGAWIGVYSEETQHWLTADDVLNGMALYDRALAATTSDPVVRRRVDGLRASILVPAIFRYNELRQAAQRRGIELASREAMIDDLEALGREFRCTTYKEWDDFSNLIKKMRDNPAPPVPEAAVHAPARIGPERLSGAATEVVAVEDGVSARRLAVDGEALGFPFMTPDKGEIAFEVPPELAGRWRVDLTLRVAATVDRQPDCAYVGVYAPYEVCRRPVMASRGESGWQTLSLGTWQLPAGSRIWVMPGVIADVGFIDVKSIDLTPAMM